MKDFSEYHVEDGQLSVSLYSTGQWVAISPQVFQRNVEVVEMLVDETLISAYSPSDFPCVGNYKTGNQVGLYLFSTEDSTIQVLLDNLIVSWNMATAEP